MNNSTRIVKKTTFEQWRMLQRRENYILKEAAIKGKNMFPIKCSLCENRK